MGQVGQRRIAERYRVVTTPVRWKVARRRRNPTRAKFSVVDAAVVEVSVLGAAIVCPAKWEAFVGTRVEVYWQGLTGTAFVHRAAPYPGSKDLVLYGIEWVDNPAVMGQALLDMFVPVTK